MNRLLCMILFILCCFINFRTKYDVYILTNATIFSTNINIIYKINEKPYQRVICNFTYQIPNNQINYGSVEYNNISISNYNNQIINVYYNSENPSEYINAKDYNKTQILINNYQKKYDSLIRFTYSTIIILLFYYITKQPIKKDNNLDEQTTETDKNKDENNNQTNYNQTNNKLKKYQRKKIGRDIINYNTDDRILFDYDLDDDSLYMKFVNNFYDPKHYRNKMRLESKKKN